MFQRIKEYLVLHPNSGLFTAFIFSITTMNTEEMVALLTATGMVISSIIGLIMQFLKWQQERAERVARLQIEVKKNELEHQRIELENERLSLENRKFLSSFEQTKNTKP